MEKKNADGTAMTPEQAKDRYEKIYWLSNMTLLTSSLNSSLKNYSFDKKVIGEGRKEGHQIVRESIHHEGRYRLRVDKGDKIWDESKIEALTSMEKRSWRFEAWASPWVFLLHQRPLLFRLRKCLLVGTPRLTSTPDYASRQT